MFGSKRKSLLGWVEECEKVPGGQFVSGNGLKVGGWQGSEEPSWWQVGQWLQGEMDMAGDRWSRCTSQTMIVLGGMLERFECINQQRWQQVHEQVRQVEIAEGQQSDMVLDQGQVCLIGVQHWCQEESVDEFSDDEICWMQTIKVKKIIGKSQHQGQPLGHRSRPSQGSELPSVEERPRPSQWSGLGTAAQPIGAKKQASSAFQVRRYLQRAGRLW